MFGYFNSYSIMDAEDKYLKEEKLGQGAYGSVYKARNLQNNQIVALKVSEFDECEEGVPSTCLRQLAILRELDHPNIVKLIDAEIFREPNPRLEMVFQYVQYDLSKYVKVKGEKGTKSLTQAESKKIIKKILEGVKYIHMKGILHRDLKPHNILIGKAGQVKVADLGLGRVCSYPLQSMSKEIQTLWYRSPQLLLGSTKYGDGVDVWSLGCIFYEMIQGKPLFQSDSQIGQIFQIFSILGTPHLSEWPQITTLPDFKVKFPKFKPHPPMFRKLSFSGQQWMWKLLKANPKQRTSISSALKDKYLEQD